MIADLQADELLDARADVFHALKEMARTIDYKGASDRKVYLEMIGAYVPVTKLALPSMRLRLSQLCRPLSPLGHTQR